jgi:sugar phosphate isomerase/epimerase
MQLSLSVRVAEAETKDRLNIGFDELVRLAADTGYAAVCMRASAGGVQTPRDNLLAMRRLLDEHKLAVSMVTTDFDVPRNNDHGPDNLRNIGPHLDAAECLGATLIRVCMKRDEDIAAAARAADQAAERGIRLAHQCHTNSLFETVDQIVDVLQRVNRPNFGLIYEPANLMLCGQPYGEQPLKRFAPWLMNVYVQNHQLAPDGPVCLPTRVRGDVRYLDIPLWTAGGVDFDQVFAGLKAIGYQGHVTVHQQFAKLMDPTEAAQQSFDFLWRYVRG